MPGSFLDAKKSPFRHALTTAQCIQYALDKPGVLTVLGGPCNERELKEILAYINTTEEDRDYSVISSFTPEESVGTCVYCRHCHPCPAGLDIGLMNKYYDLALLGDTLAREHYLTLKRQHLTVLAADTAIEDVLFKVMQMERMEEIERYFGK